MFMNYTFISGNDKKEDFSSNNPGLVIKKNQANDIFNQILTMSPGKELFVMQDKSMDSFEISNTKDFAKTFSFNMTNEDDIGLLMLLLQKEGIIVHFHQS